MYMHRLTVFWKDSSERKSPRALVDEPEYFTDW